MIVPLTDTEIEMCKHIGRQRVFYNDANGIANTTVSAQGRTAMHELGVIGEYAFSKTFNVAIDLSLEPRPFDCIFNERRCDIKTTDKRSGKLVCSTFDKDDVDIYVLCVVGPFHVELVGWCYSTDLRCKENITDLGYGEVYALSQSQLRKFKQDLNDERLQTTAQVPNATATNAVR